MDLLEILALCDQSTTVEDILKAYETTGCRFNVNDGIISEVVL